LQTEIQQIRRGFNVKLSKKKKLESAGWKVASVDEFLGLSEAEMVIVDMKLSLAESVKSLRQKKGLSQEKLASLIGSSQSRVAKMESADRSVSIELLIKTLASLGATRAQIGKFVGRGA